jgi:hypothetical protein
VLCCAVMYHREEEREAKRAAEALAAEEAREAEAKAASDELNKWKDMFVVETAGTNEDDAVEESQGQLQLFIDYVKVGTGVVVCPVELT